MLDEHGARKLVIDFMEAMLVWEVSFYKAKKAVWDIDGDDTDVNSEAKKKLSNIFEEFVIKDKVNYSRLVSLRCQSPPRYNYQRDDLEEFSVVGGSAYATFIQQEGLEETIRLEVDLKIKKIKRSENIGLKGSWERISL